MTSEDQQRQRSGRRMRSSVLAAAITLASLTGGLLHAGSSSPANADTPTAVGVDGADLVDEVGGLIRITEPAILGPFAAETPGAVERSTRTESAPSVVETLTLHSRPGATRKILLDFDGGTITSRYWNGGRPIQAAAYSRGSDTSNQSFSEIDLVEMRRIWEKVSDDYAAWDVDVTTEDPRSSGLARSDSGDVHYGVRIMITPTSSWYETRGSGGVAYVDTFDFAEDLPAFVFSANLANGSSNSVAEAVSHEAGHTLGLHHDGVHVQNADGSATHLEYYGGHGDWAPIMGVGYSRPLTQWSKGEYPGATTTQDDIAVIDRYLTRLPGTATGAATAIGPGQSTTGHTISRGG
ncbi:MAG: zinc-dependent metalloprotease family protein, partial [Ilumatobacter sp.]